MEVVSTWQVQFADDVGVQRLRGMGVVGVTLACWVGRGSGGWSIVAGRGGGRGGRDMVAGENHSVMALLGFGRLQEVRRAWERRLLKWFSEPMLFTARCDGYLCCLSAQPLRVSFRKRLLRVVVSVWPLFASDRGFVDRSVGVAER